MHQRHPLLEHAIDYAGLFPPATLPVIEAAARYAEHAGSEDAWALGRFVVPVSRLDDLAAALPRFPERWPIAVTLGATPNREVPVITEAEARHPRLRIEAVEGRAADGSEALALLRVLPDRYARFVELPLDPDPEPAIALIAAAGGGAKFRTGGVVPDAFPDPDALLRALAAAVRRGAPFKCTAGLHHPVRGRYRLTYEAGSALAPMYGYLNVLVAAAALLDGWPLSEVRAILLEERPTAFALSGQGVAWRDRWIPAGTTSALRRDLFWGFGSCSFREPMDELGEIPVA